MGCCNLFLPQKNSFSSPYTIFRPEKSYDPLSTPPTPFLPRLIPLQTPFSPSFRLASHNIHRPLANTHINLFSDTPRTLRTTTRRPRSPLLIFFFTSSVSVAALCSRWRCAFFFQEQKDREKKKKKLYKDALTPAASSQILPEDLHDARTAQLCAAQRRAVGPTVVLHTPTVLLQGPVDPPLLFVEKNYMQGG